MIAVYVAHPLRGRDADPAEIEANIAKVTEICERIREVNPDLLILSPIHAFGFVDPLGPQEWVLEQCRGLLACADELWVFGDWQNSEGCRMEVEHAKVLGIPVLY